MGKGWRERREGKLRKGRERSDKRRQGKVKGRKGGLGRDREKGG